MKPISTLFILATVTGCGQAKVLYNMVRDEMGNKKARNATATPGDPASQHLLRAVGLSASNDTTALLETLKLGERQSSAASLAEDSREPPELSAAATGLLLQAQRNKRDHDPTTYVKIDEGELGRVASLTAVPYSFAEDTVNWTATDVSEFTISTLGKMPVRDQGRRGTCAAFAGTAQLEAFLLKAYKDLEGLDLSEQRFYYMSKPENWASGGSASSGGSNSGTGFATSAGVMVDDIAFPSDWPTPYNIPLETSCPYNPEVGSNDLQTPQASGCLQGVAKVKAFAAWMQNSSSMVTTAQQIFDTLRERDLPVIVGTRLSENWERNDGLITQADAGEPGDSSHATGHAYLVVGAKKLDPAQFPGEGGMCFIIRNSWGNGWGAGGLSCMTLAWFNKWRFAYSFPIVLDAELDSAPFGNPRRDNTVVPTNITYPSGTSSSSLKRGTAILRLLPEDGDMQPQLLASPTDWSATLLRAENDEYYRVLYRKQGSSLVLRGLVNGSEKTTLELWLKLSGNSILFSDSQKSNIVVGNLDETKPELVLCSGRYTRTCDLHYVKENNELLLGLTELEHNTESADGPFNWHTVSLGGYGFEFSKPGALNSKVDVRLKLASKTTNPLRFLVTPSSGDIVYDGKTVGNALNFSLCSGRFASVCQLGVSQQEFNLFHKAKRP